MKKFVAGLVVLSGVVLWAVIYQPTKPANAITVSLQNETGGGTQSVPALDGFVSGHGSLGGSQNGPDQAFHAEESYKVVTNLSGDFIVLAHYVITRGGISTTFDRALPVWRKQPEKSDWAKLDAHFISVAYLSENSNQ